MKQAQQMLKLRNVTIFKKYMPILNLMPETHSKKSWDRGMIVHTVVLKVKYFPILACYRISAAQQFGVSFVICFITCAKCFP